MDESPANAGKTCVHTQQLILRKSTHKIIYLKVSPCQELHRREACQPVVIAFVQAETFTGQSDATKMTHRTIGKILQRARFSREPDSATRLLLRSADCTNVFSTRIGEHITNRSEHAHPILRSMTHDKIIVQFCDDCTRTSCLRKPVAATATMAITQPTRVRTR